MSQNTLLDSAIYSKMQVGAPMKSYKKTIMGQVLVKVINPFTGSPEEKILKGDPAKNEETAIIDVWSDVEDVYFKRSNTKHLSSGNIIEFSRPEVFEKPESEIYNTMSDAELNNLLGKRFGEIKAATNKMTSEAPITRLIRFAQEQEKSEKLIKALEARLYEIQTA